MIIELPQVGESVTEGVIGKWLKSVGDRVERFDPLVEVVTDKVNMEMPSPVTGTLTALLVDEGETIPMGTPIAEVAVEGESCQRSSSERAPAPPAESPPVDRIGILLKDVAPVGPTGSGGPISSARPTGQDHGRRRYTPAVLRLATERGVDLEMVQGTGIGGRVTLKDVRSFIEQDEQAAASTESVIRVSDSRGGRGACPPQSGPADDCREHGQERLGDTAGVDAGRGRRDRTRGAAAGRARRFSAARGYQHHLPALRHEGGSGVSQGKPSPQLVLGRRRHHLQAPDQHRDRGRGSGRPCRSGSTRRGHAQRRGPCEED